MPVPGDKAAMGSDWPEWKSHMMTGSLGRVLLILPVDD